MTSTFPERLAAGIVRRPRRVLAAWILIAAAAGWLIAGFRIDPDIAALFTRDDPTLRLTRHLQGDAAMTRSLLVVLRGNDATRIEEVLPAVAAALRESPHLARVIATRQEFAGSRYEWGRRAPLAMLPDTAVERLKARLVGDERRKELESSLRRLEEDPIAGKEIVRRDPLGLRWVFGESADLLADRFPSRLRPGSPWILFENPPVALIRAVGKDDSYQMDFSKALLEGVEARVGAVLGPGVRAELAGGYVSARAHAASMRADMIAQTIASSILVMLFLTWFTRSLLAPFVLLVPVALSIVCGLAFGGALLGPLSPIVMSVAAILVAQPVDFSLHFFSRFREERKGMARDAALIRSQASLERPFLGAAGATMSAFLVLLSSRFPGFVHLGMLLFLGMVVLLVASLTLFPVLLMGLDRLIRPAKETEPWLVTWALRVMGTRGRWVAVGVLVAVGLASWGAVAAGRIRVDLDLRNLIAPGDPGQAVLDRLEKDLGISVGPVCALVDAATPVEELRSRVEALRAKGVAAFANGVHELFPSPARVERNARFVRETAGWVDGTLKELAAVGFRPEPFSEGLESFRKSFEAEAPAPAWLEDPAFATLKREFFYEDEGRKSAVIYLFPPRSLWTPGERSVFDGAVRAELGPETRLYSAFHLPDHYAKLLTADLGRVAGWTSLAVLLLTLVSLGNLWDGLRALVPVIVATGVTLLTCVFLGGTLNLMNMVAIPIILGTGVDGGIHYVARLRELGSRDPMQALKDTGPGVWGSAVTTLLGFGAIGGSSTPGLSSMGVLVMIGTAVVLAATFFLLPALFPSKRPAP